MNTQETSEQLRWERMRKLGRPSYLRRCAFGWLVFGALLYPFLQGVDLAFGWQPSDPHYPSLAPFIISVLSGGVCGYIYGRLGWRLCERRHQANSTPIPVA